MTETMGRDTTAIKTRPRLLYVSCQGTAAGSAAGTHVSEICDGLRRHGWEVLLFAPSHGGTVRTPARIGSWLQVLSASGRAVRSCDVVYVRSHPAALIISSIAGLLRKPVVQEVNGPYDDYYLARPWLRRISGPLQSLIRWQLRQAAAVVAVTAGLARWVTQEAPAARVAVIANGVDPARFHVAASARPALLQPYAIFVGNLARWQGLATVLDAARSPEWPNEVALVVVGDGRERSSVEDAVRLQPSRIHYLGSLPHEDVPGLLGNSLAAIVSSQDRAGTGVAPLKLFEAMASGVPIVGFEVDDLASLVRAADCGVLVPVGDARGMAAAVGRLAAEPSRVTSMGQRARAAAVQDHSWEERSRRTAELLGDVLREGTRQH